MIPFNTNILFFPNPNELKKNYFKNYRNKYSTYFYFIYMGSKK